MAIMHRFHAEKAYTTAVTLRFTADLRSRHADYPIGGMAPVLAKNLRELRVRRPLEPPGGDLFDNDWRHYVRHHGYLKQPIANVIRENVRRMREVLARAKGTSSFTPNPRIRADCRRRLWHTP